MPATHHPQADRRAPERWLLLRGLGREAAHWHELPDQLSLRLGLAPPAVGCLDLPGIGALRDRPAPLSLAATTDMVRHEWSRKPDAASASWGLLGISMGAMVAVDWAGRFPDDLTRVALINPSDAATAAPWLRLRWQCLGLGLKIAIARELRRREELVLELTTRRVEGNRRDRLLDERVALLRERPISNRLVVRQLWAALWWRAPRAVTVPTLVMVSRGDRMVAPACGERLAERLAAHLVQHQWAGHDLPLDDPAWVCDQLHAWLAL